MRWEGGFQCDGEGEQSQALCEVVLRVLLEDMGAERATFGPVFVPGFRTSLLRFLPNTSLCPTDDVVV